LLPPLTSTLGFDSMTNSTERLPMYISHSSLGLLSSCARKFEFNKVILAEDEVRLMDRGVAADAGTAIHIGYQSYLRDRDVDKAVWNLMCAYPLDICYDNMDPRSLEACVNTLLAAIDSKLMQEWELIQIKCLDGVTRDAVEVPFEIVLDGITLPDGRGISFIGYIDAILWSRFSDVYNTWDIKTHRHSMRDQTAKFKFSGQQIPYGIILEYILGKRITQFEVTYLNMFVDVLEPDISVYPFIKTREEIEDWIVNVLLEVKRLWHFMKTEHFPRTQHGCLAFNYPCKFLDVCDVRERDKVKRLLFLEQGDNMKPAGKFTPWIRAKLEVPEALRP